MIEQASPKEPKAVARAQSLRGLRKAAFACELAILTFLVKRRMSPALAVPLFRRVAPMLEDSTLLPENDALVPAGVRSTLDIAYGASHEQRLDVFRPEAGAGMPVVVWVHGGGWISGSKRDVRPYLQTLAARGYVVVGVDYTLAPELRYPGQIAQASEALAWAIENAQDFSGDPRRVFLAGDSAGANISAQLARAVTDSDYRRRAGIHVTRTDASALRGVVLTSGAFVLENMGGAGRMGSIGDLMVRCYTGTRSYADSPALRCASLAADMGSTFPPAFVTAGNADPLLSDSMMLVEALRRESVPVRTAFFPEDHEVALPHGYCCDLRRPEARETLDALTDFLREFS